MLGIAVNQITEFFHLPKGFLLPGFESPRERKEQLSSVCVAQVSLTVFQLITFPGQGEMLNFLFWREV